MTNEEFQAEINGTVAGILAECDRLKQKMETYDKRLDEELTANKAKQHEIAVMQRKIQELIENTGNSDYIFGDYS